MYVTSLTCDFVTFDDEMVVYLTRLTLSAVENSSRFFFAVAYLKYVSGGRRNLVNWQDWSVLFLGKFCQGMHYRGTGVSSLID